MSYSYISDDHDSDKIIISLILSAMACFLLESWIAVLVCCIITIGTLALDDKIDKLRYDLWFSDKLCIEEEGVRY